MRNALNSRAVTGALSNRSALHNPNARGRVVASAALAGRHFGRGGGWWRHRNGGYGWVGPLFWPFAYYDMYDYAFWGDDYDTSFWGYGYDDIYAGVFAPYGYDDLAGYLPRRAGGVGPAAAYAAAPNQLTQMCGEDNGDIAGLPVDRIQQTIAPTEAQRAALDDLAKASAEASRGLKAACPTDISLTAPARLAAMQKRIEAMIAAVDIVQPPLENFYGLLNDEQKARLTALGNNQRQRRSSAKSVDSLSQNCGTAQSTSSPWPTAEIERTVQPTEAQRAALSELQNATAKASDMLKTSCPADNQLTPPARLKAVGERLDTMLQAVKTVDTALNGFYGQLNDEQKARFEALGPQRTSQSDQADDQPRARRAHARAHGIYGLRSMLRRFGI